MIDQRLYVDGELMDISEDMAITLDIKSNLFRNVTEITANNTYTVNLPKTAHNLSVLEHSDKPKSKTNYPYIFHVCRYFRNGVEIIKDGRLTLMSVTDSIEVSIYWGVFPAFNKLQEDEKKLCDLKTDIHLTFQQINTTDDSQVATEKGVFYADYVTEQITDDTDSWKSSYNDITPDGVITDSHVSNIFDWRKRAYRQPCVTCKWLLSLIETDTGVEFHFPISDRRYLENLVIPLISNKADEKTVTGSLSAIIQSTTKVGQLTFTLNDSISSFKEQAGTNTDTLTVTKDCNLHFDVQMKYSWDVEYGGWGQPDTGGTGTPDDDIERPDYENCKQVFPYYIEMSIKRYSVSGDGETDTYIIGNAFYSDGMRKSYLVYEKEAISGRCHRLIEGSGNIEFNKNDKITFSLKNEGGTLHDTQIYSAFISASVKIGDEVPVGGLFPIGINLPEISVLDFIRFLALITGTYARQLSDSQKVDFVHISSMWDNRKLALDWSGRLIAMEPRNTPRKSEFSVSDYCQHNYYKWKEDEQTKGNYDADFQIGNTTLDYEQEAWTLPFAATDGDRIPIRTPYTKDGDTEKGGEYKACKDRIVTLTNDTRATLYFNIDLAKIFSTRYGNLAKTISKAHVITEYLYLSDLEILNFDETKPVYIAQYGAYFAVLELKVSNSGYTEATMIELEF